MDCSNAYQQTAEDQRAISDSYQECVQEAARASVRELFAYLREHQAVRPSALVINALGTGTGRLHKERWYPQITSEILASIQDAAHAVNLPAHIFLSVNLNEIGDSDKWAEDRTAIAESVGALVRDWTLTDHEVPKSITATTLLIPALIAIGILSLSVLIGFPRITPESPLWRAVFKTFLETAGVMSIFVAVFGGPGEREGLWLFLVLASLFLLGTSFLFLRENLQKKN